MTDRASWTKLTVAAILAVLAPCGAAAAEQSGPGNPSLAGQMCPAGSYVIGFDSAGNIVCSDTCGNGVLDAGEACDDGNSEAGDGCSPACRPETTQADAAAAAVAGGTAAAAVAGGTEAAAPDAAEPQPQPISEGPVITDVEPSSIVYGTRETAVTISGSGFNTDSVIVFAGSRYTPKVNANGTLLEATLVTSKLTIGRYALTVSNGPGQENTLKKALVVY